MCLNNFRSRSLLGWVHKLVTQVLVDILKKVVGKLVRGTQSIFIKDRSIFEGGTVASKVLDEMRRF